MASDEGGSVAFVFRFARAVRASQAASSTKLVLLVLASYADSTGSNAFPSERRIARDTSLSRSTVQAHLRLAVAAGFLERDGKKGRANRFRLAIPIVRESADFQTQSAGEGNRTASLTGPIIGPPAAENGPMIGPPQDPNGPMVGPPQDLNGPMVGPDMDRSSGLTSPMTNPIQRRAHARGEPCGFRAVVQAMTEAGVTHCLSDRGQRMIRTWVQEGISLPVCHEAIERARRSKPDAPIPIGYLRPIVHELTSNNRQADGNSSRSRETGVGRFWQRAIESQ